MTCGNPLVENPLFLLTAAFRKSQVKKRYQSLWRYFQEGKERGVADRYLCQHRSPWYAQENSPPAPFVCTYLGRGNVKSGRPFRFILNQSRATVTNVYLALYPKQTVTRAIKQNPSLARRVWEILNRISPAFHARRRPSLWRRLAQARTEGTGKCSRPRSCRSFARGFAVS